MNMDMVSDRRKHPLEALVKVSLGLDMRNPVNTPTVSFSLFLESWRTLRFLINLGMVLVRRKHPLEAFIKIGF